MYNFYFDIVFNARSFISNDNDSDYVGHILLVIQHDPLIYKNPSLIIDDNNNNEDYFGCTGRTVNNKSYNTICNFHFDTVIAAIVAGAPAVAVGAPSVFKMKTYATIFITFSCLHIIDHGSVLYLILQILLYNQQYI